MTPNKTNLPPAHLSELRSFIFDMDGVIYRGEQVLPGAVDFVAALRAAQVPLLFLTNNATTVPGRVVERLEKMGISASTREVFTSALATAAVLQSEMPGARVLLVGEDGVRQALLDAGHTLTADHREADAVVVSYDRALTYDKLCEASLGIQRGAPFFATNTDRTLPTELGLLPGAGTIVGAVEIATGVAPRVIGKPQAGIFFQALAKLGTDAQLTGAVGDRPETDILGAQRAGLRTVAVLTGVGTPEDFSSMETPPDWVVPDLAALHRAYF